MNEMLQAWTLLRPSDVIVEILGIIPKRDPRAEPRSVTMRGGTPLAWLDLVVHSSLMVLAHITRLLKGPFGPQRGHSVDRRTINPAPLGGPFGFFFNSMDFNIH